MTASAHERAVLADELSSRGPSAPTLCEGWSARDLAAHLVVREGRPDAALGVVLPPLAGYAERVRSQVGDRPFEDLVATFRAGPPRLSPFAVPGVDRAVNAVEHFVHAEDLRRAGDHPAEPRDLSAEVRTALWRSLRLTARLTYRRSPVGVVLQSPERREVVRRAPDGAGEVVVRGDVGELVLHGAGREAVARVDLDGTPEDVRVLGGLRREI